VIDLVTVDGADVKDQIIGYFGTLNQPIRRLVFGQYSYLVHSSEQFIVFNNRLFSFLHLFSGHLLKFSHVI
jgi:hypothetical protein